MTNSQDARTRAAPTVRATGFAAGVRVAVVRGADQGRVIELEPGSATVGTEGGCTIRLTDALVSRRHLEITAAAEGLRLRDLGSTNGSFFQGARFDAIEVTSGGLVRVGDTELRLERRDLEGAARAGFGPLVGAAPAMQPVLERLERLAAGDLNALIEGETGTGKELAAEAIHAASARAQGPFVVFDVTSVAPEAVEAALSGGPDGGGGAFADAEKGTLLIDHIGELEAAIQPRLLRVLERREIRPPGSSRPRTVDVRVLAASGLSLADAVADGRFRSDLYHRVAVAQLVLPPLRDRRQDVPLLVEHFVMRASVDRSAPLVPAAVMELLCAYDWPGNVRELRNVVEQAVSLAGPSPTLDAAVLGIDAQLPPMEIPDPQPRGRLVRFKEAKERLIDVWEREYLVALLDRTGGNVSVAARRAGMSRPHLHAMIKKHALKVRERDDES